MIDTFAEKGMKKKQIMNMLTREEREMLEEEKFFEEMKKEHERYGAGGLRKFKWKAYLNIFVFCI